MKKKLLAVAVAGAFAIPGVALAQSSVTISGLFKGGIESLKYSNSAKANNGQVGVVDDSSRVVFNVVEDLGGGLQAIGQFDIRLKLDDPSGSPANNATGGAPGGNTHIGLRSSSWGRLLIGRQDVHYFNTESNIADKASLRLVPFSLLSYAAGGGVAVAATTRTPNIVHYTTPNWGGFTMIAAWSANPQVTAGLPLAEADIGSGVRKGSAWTLNPNMAGSNWQVGYSYWRSKPDAGTNAAGTADQRGDRLYGSYKWGGLKAGLAWDKSKLKGALNGVVVSDRTAWSIPVSYSWGAHEIHGHYTKARNDKAAAFAGLDTQAKMWAIAYVYNLSKRTSAG